MYVLNAFLFCRKLRDVLQQRLIKFFIDQSKKDAEKYAKFFEDYGLFMREGIVTTTEQEVKVGAVFQAFLWAALSLGLLRKLVEASPDVMVVQLGPLATAAAAARVRKWKVGPLGLWHLPAAS